MGVTFFTLQSSCCISFHILSNVYCEQFPNTHKKQGDTAVNTHKSSLDSVMTGSRLLPCLHGLVTKPSQWEMHQSKLQA